MKIYKRKFVAVVTITLEKISVGLASTILIFFGMVASVSAVTLLDLPDPNAKYGTSGGVYVAWAHDDFWSYSGQLMQEIGLGFVTTGSGTGNLDLKVYSNGQVNSTFESSVPTQGGSVTYLEGWWGQNDQNNDGIPDNVNGPVSVGQLMAYIESSVPVFYMDLNQTGANQDLFFTGRVMIINPADGSIYRQYAFDSNPQGGDGGPSYYEAGTRPGSYDADFPGFGAAGDYNTDAYAVALGTIATGDYVANHNLGSGKYDYIAYSPLIDLSTYPADYLFVVEFHLGNPLATSGKDWGAMNNGFEEIFLTGLYSARVPEPMTLLLLGLGLIGLAGVSRKFRLKK